MIGGVPGGSVFSRVQFVSEGGNSDRFLTECVRLGAPVSAVCPTPYGFVASVAAGWYPRLRIPAREAGCRLHIRRKSGVWFRLRHWKRHTGVAAGGLLILLLMVLLRSLVWNIEYYGAAESDRQELSDRLFRCGIYQGCLASDEKLRAAEDVLMLQTNAYAGISLNFAKGKLVVEVEPATPAPKMYLPQDWDITASEAGVVRQVEIYSGTGVVQVGQMVDRGDVLVRSVWTDQENVLQPSPCRARIMAYIEKNCVTACPLEWEKERITGTHTDGLALYFADVCIPLKKGTDGDAVPVQRGISILGLPLPVTLYRTVSTDREVRTLTLTEEQAKQKCVQTLNALLYSEHPEMEVLSREYRYEVTDGTVFCTLHLRAYADIAAEPVFEKKISA